MPVCPGCKRYFVTNSNLENHQRQPKGACHRHYEAHRESDLIRDTLASLRKRGNPATRIGESGEHLGSAAAAYVDSPPNFDADINLIHESGHDIGDDLGSGTQQEFQNVPVESHSSVISDDPDNRSPQGHDLNDLPADMSIVSEHMTTIPLQLEGEGNEDRSDEEATNDVDDANGGSDMEATIVPEGQDNAEPAGDELGEEEEQGEEREEEHPGLPTATVQLYSHTNLTQQHPYSIADLGKGTTILDRFRNDEHSGHRAQFPYYPFRGFEEWQFASILDRMNVSLPHLDNILSSNLIKSHSLTFTNGSTLRRYMENLPGEGSGLPKWTSRTITLTGYPTAEPIVFYYRDSAECVQHLFGNPLFAGSMSLSARKEYDANGDRVYSEWVTGDMAWRVQDALPKGAAPLGVIASSDKTALTSHAGNKVAHPLLLSLANIDMSIRNRSSYHAFLLLGLLPIPQFYESDRKLLSVLYHRLIHLCLDIVFAPLKKIATEGARMTDPEGHLRLCYTVLASYMVDYPEALMLAGVMGLTSPVTTASYLNFGDPQPHPRRHGADTMRIIKAIEEVADPWEDIDTFIRLAKDHRLSGIHKPFYRDWPFADPSLFLTPDRLHTLLKKFWDHDVKWCIAALSAPEIDFRFSLLPERIGFRHFHTGISALKMATGREHRDIQRSIVAVILGGCPLGFVRCIRALIDYFYISQRDVITANDVLALKDYLAEFHQHKDIILGNRYREANNWRVPKIELLCNVVYSVSQMGAARQWSTDRTEHAHIEVVKRPFRASNHKDFTPQICRYLDRAEKRRFFDQCTALIKIFDDQGGRVNPRSLVSSIEPAYSWLSEMRTVESLTAADRDPADYFHIAERVRELARSRTLSRKELTKKRTFCTASTAYHLNGQFDRKLSIKDAEALYGLPDLYDSLVELCDGVAELGGWQNAECAPPNRWRNGRIEPCVGRRRRNITSTDQIPFTQIRIWEQVRVQAKVREGGHSIAPRVIKAIPPRDPWVKGRYDCCILKNDYTATWSGRIDRHLRDFCVAQVRLVFQPVFNRGESFRVPYFAYVQRFDSQPLDDMYAASRLPRLQRSVRQVLGSTARRGGVVGLSRMLTAVDIVPFFGDAADGRLTKYNSMEFSSQFHLNIYSDKHIHTMFQTHD